MSHMSIGATPLPLPSAPGFQAGQNQKPDERRRATPTARWLSFLTSCSLHKFFYPLLVRVTSARE
jgi:hypothetical protein